MRRAEAVLVAALAVGCTRTTSAAPERGPVGARIEQVAVVAPDARPSGAPDAAPAMGEPVFVKVEAFDCEKFEVFPGEAPSKGPIPAKGGIRAWHGGGPNGANWNVQDLRCTVRATTSCTRGWAMLTLRVGQRTVAERQVAVSKGAAVFDLVVPEAAWEKGYDTPAKAAALKLPFKTAAFRAQVAVACEAPEQIRPDRWRFPSIAAEDMFVAGFASGE